MRWKLVQQMMEIFIIGSFYFSSKFIICSENRTEEKSSLNLCLFNAIYVSCNQLPNYPLGRYRSTFYEYYLSNRSIINDLSLSINSATHQQLDTCLNAFLEHSCSTNSSCLEFVRSAKKIFVEEKQQQTSVPDEQMLRSLGDRRLNRYREQVFQLFKSICEHFRTSTNIDTTTKITEGLLRERLLPMPRATFIRELTDTIHWKQSQTPDLALLYRVYAESGTKIPLNDWFEVRRSINLETHRVFFLVFCFICWRTRDDWWFERQNNFVNEFSFHNRDKRIKRIFFS